MILLALIWMITDMSNLSLALIALFIFCLLMFVFVHTLILKINIIKLANTELNDKLVLKTSIVAILFFFLVFMLLFLITNDRFFILLSQLMTLKIYSGFNLYTSWREDQNSHDLKQLLLCLLFYIVKPK